jgi:pSer/pThr/pTyr-binding forkhead associated (FHA) protein
MSSSSLPDHLQAHSQSQETGCLLIEGSSGVAVVYLLDGEVVYAEANEAQGLAGIFLPMSWEDAQVTWQPRVRPPKVLFKHSVEELLFQYAQLEDSGQADQEFLSDHFTADASRPASTIKLMDLSQYEVSFEVLNSTFQGFQFIVDRPELLIGRLEDCHVILPDGSVSGHHCKILQQDHCMRVIDLGSTNGTVVNGELISDSVLQVDDEFQIGSIALAMRLKMRRKLEQAPVIEQPILVAEQRPALGTQKIDPKILNKKTSKVTGPITWKNLTADAPKKTTSSNSLFSKMFGKK